MSSRTLFTLAAVLILGGIVLSRLMAEQPAKIAAAADADAAAANAPVASASPAPGSPAPASGSAGSATPAPAPTAIATPAPAASPTAAASPSAKIDPVLETEFLSARTAAFAVMPKQADLQKLSAEQAHFTPQAVISAASAIGRVSEMVKEHPELAAKGLDFYKQCAEKETAPESLRASCLADFTRLQTKSGAAASAPKVPKRVAALADKILS